MTYTNVSKFFFLVAAMWDDESGYVFVGLTTAHAIEKLDDGAFRAHTILSNPPPPNTKRRTKERERVFFFYRFSCCRRDTNPTGLTGICYPNTGVWIKYPQSSIKVQRRL